MSGFFEELQRRKVYRVAIIVQSRVLQRVPIVDLPVFCAFDGQTQISNTLMLNIRQTHRQDSSITSVRSVERTQ